MLRGNLDTGVIVAATLHPADHGDTTTLAGTLTAAAENLALPMWAGIAPEQQQRIVETVLDAVGVASAR